MSARSSVTLTMSPGVQPAALRMASTFASISRVCASSPSASLPVAGSRPDCAATKTRLPARMACEYVPIAGGADHASGAAALVLLFADFNQPLLNGAGETWDDHFKFRNVAQRNKVHELRLDQMIQTAALLDHCTL